MRAALTIPSPPQGHPGRENPVLAACRTLPRDTFLAHGDAAPCMLELWMADVLHGENANASTFHHADGLRPLAPTATSRLTILSSGRAIRMRSKVHPLRRMRLRLVLRKPNPFNFRHGSCKKASRFHRRPLPNLTFST